MPAASILIRLLDGDTVVHEFRRSTTLHEDGSLVRMLGSAMGWMQAYQGQATNDQWRKDVEHARRGPPAD